MKLGELNLIGIDDVFSYANNTNEQDLVEIIATETEPVFLFKINIDLSNLAQNATLRLYYKVDDTNYRLRYGTGIAGGTVSWVQATDAPQVSFLVNDIVDHDLKITIQSSLAQGGVKSIPFSYNGGR